MVGSCPELWAFFGSWRTPHVHVVRVGIGGTERLCSWVLGSLSYSDKPDYVVNTNMKTFLFIPLRPLIWLIFLKLENCLLVCFERCKNHTKLERNWEKNRTKCLVTEKYYQILLTVVQPLSHFVSCFSGAHHWSKEPHSLVFKRTLLHAGYVGIF